MRFFSCLYQKKSDILTIREYGIMRRNYKIFMLIAILVIGFAAVSTTIVINGFTRVGTNEEDFDVFFYSVTLDDLIVTNDVLSKDKKTLNFATNEINVLGESSTLKFSVINNSSQYNAEVSIECTIPSGDDYTVEVSPLSMTINAGKRFDGTIKATLTKALIDAKDVQISCTLNANPTSRTSSVPKVVDKNMYDVILVGDSIMNGYGNDFKTFDYYLKEAGLVPESSLAMNLSQNSSMLFTSPYVEENQLILDTQIRKYLFDKVANVKEDAYIMINGGINDLTHNLQYDNYTLGVASTDEFNNSSYFQDVMASDNLVSRIYNILSGVGMTFPNNKIIYIKPRLLPESITKEYYKDVASINADITLFNQAIDFWQQRIGKKYPNLTIIDSNDYVLESDLRYALVPNDGVHWQASAYQKIVESLAN